MKNYIEYLIKNINSAKFNFNKDVNITDFCSEVIKKFPKVKDDYKNDERLISALIEWFSLAKFLQFAIRLYRIQSPISIIKREHPDFELHSNVSIGIEHRLGHTEKSGYASHLFSKADKHAYLDINSDLFNDKKPRKEEIMKLIDESNNEAFYADQSEFLWAKMILNMIAVKTHKLNTKNFRKFDKNTLLISEKIGVVDSKVKKLKILRELYSEDNRLKEINYSFDEIYIISSRWIEKV